MWELVVLISVGLLMIASVIKGYLAHDERMASLPQTSQNLSRDVAALREEVATLREEVKSLRETSSQYDLSLQQVLETVDHRVAAIEAQKRSGQPAASTTDEPHVNIGR
ncbi:MAG TPA: hypothetical protein VGK19_23925 [Capsulimonadaceae bacterium]|jgi:predicted  nucleic acid-binding Zn-ribbon protein